MKRSLQEILVGTLVLGSVSTLGDWIWTNYLTDGAILPGVIHGAVIFLILAAILAWSVGTPRAWKKLLPSLPVAGIALAAVFYPIAYTIGYLPALLVTWIGMWLTLALLYRWACEEKEPILRAIFRGIAASIGSGVAFWLISGIWTNPAPETNYLLHFASWSFAFFPGFAALLFRR